MRAPRTLALELILAPPALLALFLVVYGPLLGGAWSVATFQDNTYLLLPLLSHMARSVARGEFPYWIDTIAGGLPLYDTPQLSATYPFYFLGLGLYADPVRALVHAHHVALFHVLLAEANTYVMLRLLGLGPVPAVLGASLFGLGANLFTYTVWINIVAAYAWLPLVVGGTVLVLEDRRVRTGVLLGAAALALLIMAHPAQPLIHAAYLVAALWAFRAGRLAIRRELGALVRVTRNLGALAGLALVVASPALVPAALATGEAIRFLGQAPPLLGHARVPFEASLVGQYEPALLLGALIPFKSPDVVGSPHVGAGAVFLALLGLLRVRRAWVVGPLAAVAVWGLLSATGSHLGLAQLNHQLPLLNRIREPARHLTLYALSAAALAAFGLAGLQETAGPRADPLPPPAARGARARPCRAVLAAAALFLVLWGLALASGLPYVGTVSGPAHAGLTAAAVAVLAIAALRGPPLAGSRAARLLAAGGGLLVVSASIQYAKPVLRVEDGDYFWPANLASHAVLRELARLPDIRHYRVVFEDTRLEPRLWSMNASYYGVRSFQGYMNPLPRRQFEEIFWHSHRRHYYPLLGAKYYLCDPCTAPVLADYRRAATIDGYALYVTERALPRYHAVSRIAGTYEDATDFYAKVHAGYDYRTHAYVPRAEARRARAWLGDSPAPRAFRIAEESASLNRIRLRVEAEGRIILVLNEYERPAWAATVNGARVRTLRVNLNQVGVLLEAGPSRVELAYRPRLFLGLLWLAGGAMAVLGAWVLVALWRAGAGRRAA
jgi:hypothetical protein